MVKLKAVLAVAFSLGCFSCANTNYQVGDISKNYCSSTDPQFRAAMKAIILKSGVHVPVDYCLTYGLVDAMTKTPKEGG